MFLDRNDDNDDDCSNRETVKGARRQKERGQQRSSDVRSRSGRPEDWAGSYRGKISSGNVMGGT